MTAESQPVLSRTERSKLRYVQRPSPLRPLDFMGNTYETVAELGKDFPAFTGDDAIRAIRAGCQTVMEVERYCWQFRNRAYLLAVQAAQRSKYSASRARGGLSTQAKRTKARKKA
jgi:hypothetical protein